MSQAPVVATPAAGIVPVQFSLSGLLRFGWQNKWTIVLITMVAAAASVAFAVTRTPVYRTSALVQIDEMRASQRPAGGLGGFGALASVVGFDGGDAGLRDEALAILSSRAFTQSFIERYALMPVLFEDLWDDASKSWKVTDEKIPTIRDGFEFFEGEIRTVLEDRERGMITLQMEWTDRKLAAQWVAQMLEDADALLREKETASADSNIAFLNKQINETAVVGVRQSIYQLMEAQIERKMLANSRAHFVFEVIDPATVPDENEYVRPQKPLIAVLGTFMGFLFALLVCVVRGSGSVAQTDRRG